MRPARQEDGPHQPPSFERPRASAQILGRIARAMLASVFSPPAVRSKRTPATPTLVTGVTPGAYGRRDHSHQYYAYGRRVSNQRERQELADQAALAPLVAVAPLAAPIAAPVPAAKPKAATPHAPVLYCTASRRVTLTVRFVLVLILILVRLRSE